MVNALNNDETVTVRIRSNQLTCLTSVKFSSLGIPRDAKRALGSNEVVLPSIVARVSEMMFNKSHNKTEVLISPVTPDRSTFRSVSFVAKSRLDVISLRISK